MTTRRPRSAPVPKVPHGDHRAAIRQALWDRDLTVDQVARAAFIAPAALRHYLGGQYDLTLDQYAAVLDVLRLAIIPAEAVWGDGVTEQALLDGLYPGVCYARDVQYAHERIHEMERARQLRELAQALRRRQARKGLTARDRDILALYDAQVARGAKRPKRGNAGGGSGGGAISAGPSGVLADHPVNGGAESVAGPGDPAGGKPSGVVRQKGGGA